MKLNPLSDRVVLKNVEAEETTKSGIILTGSAKEKPSVAEVISVGLLDHSPLCPQTVPQHLETKYLLICILRNLSAKILAQDKLLILLGESALKEKSRASEKIKGEFASNGVDNSLSHTKGAISMARSSAPDSASSQFFIVETDSTFLDGEYAVFGYVTEGIEIVEKICADAKPTDNNGSIKKDEQPVMETVTIID